MWWITTRMDDLGTKSFLHRPCLSSSLLSNVGNCKIRSIMGLEGWKLVTKIQALTLPNCDYPSQGNFFLCQGRQPFSREHVQCVAEIFCTLLIVCVFQTLCFFQRQRVHMQIPSSSRFIHIYLVQFLNQLGFGLFFRTHLLSARNSMDHKCMYI